MSNNNHQLTTSSTRLQHSESSNNDDSLSHNDHSAYLEWKRKMGEKRKRNDKSTPPSATAAHADTTTTTPTTTHDDETMFMTPTLKKTKLIKEILNQVAKSDSVTTDDTPSFNLDTSKSLLKKSKELKESQPQLSDLEKLEQKENELLKELMNQSFLNTMQQQHHNDHTPVEYLNYGWTPPSFYTSLSDMDREYILDKFGIHVQGREIPPPILTFEHMKFPKCLLKLLDDKNITTPTPIQMQGIPCLLSGRDVIGIAFTGSGKTLVFTLPIVMYCYLEEKRKKLREGDGPLGLILCPNRELAKQTFDLVEYFFKGIEKYDSSGTIQLNVSLCIGGIREDRIFGSSGSSSSSSGLGQQQQRYYTSTQHERGIHMVVATPGRLIQMLNDRKMHLSHCRYICMDEADRLIDLGFEEEIKQIFEFLNEQQQDMNQKQQQDMNQQQQQQQDTNRPYNNDQEQDSSTEHSRHHHHIQKVFFSATMPEKIQSLARQTLSTPIIVNVGRAGAANLDVVQEVEFVMEEDKITYLLEVLQKTPPPVLIFSQNKSEVDTICEYLLLKGVEAVSIHSSKDQFEREYAIDSFKHGKKDVLVATDIVSKGIDFPNVRHVINFDMPREIENYVHRIGRTGRNGKTGLATTFINRNQSEQILLDLKYLLIEAKQRVPPILNTIYDPYAGSENMGAGSRVECKYCQGLGHRITECQKYHRDKQLQIQKALNAGGASSLGEQ